MGQKITPITWIIHVRRDYRRTVGQMIAAGGYDFVEDLIQGKYFRKKRALGVVEGDVFLVHFRRKMWTGEVEEELRRMGLRPADLTTLLAIGSGEDTRLLQMMFPIAALGAVRRMYADFGVVFLEHGKRWLDLRWRCESWPAGYRFAAVRNDLDTAVTGS